MNIFQRTIRGFLLLIGLVASVVVAVAAWLARYMVHPPRQRLWVTPDSLAMSYDAVRFMARDGVQLQGWFIPTKEKRRDGATLIVVHGWPWNRLGEAAEDMVANLSGSTPVDLLRLAHGLHADGFNVLLFDMRNHGESEATNHVSFGPNEALDVLGAVDFVNGRSDVNPSKVGLVGFSTGANAVLYALPEANVKAAIVVQPVSLDHFAARFGHDMFSVAGKLIVPLTEMMYRAAGGSPFAQVRPGSAALDGGETAVLFVQGKGDKWGSIADVAQMAATIPNGHGPLFVETEHRTGGYQYLVEHPEVATQFFEAHFATYHEEPLIPA